MKKIPFIVILILLSSCMERISPSWEELAAPCELKLLGIAQVQDSSLWIAGGQSFGEECFLHSTDKGSQWQKQEEFFGQTWYDIFFEDERNGVASGIAGKALFTEDGGQSWRLSQIPYWLPMRSIASSDSVVISVGGVAYDNGLIARSIDRGLNWVIVDTPEVELRAVVFTEPQTAYACGFGTIFKTEDAGLSWRLLPVAGEFFTSLSFPSPQIGFAVGRTGSIFKTQDAGESWELLRNGDGIHTAPHFYNQVLFWDEQIGYIVGDKGLVLQTTDGGQNWLRLKNDIKNDLFDLLLITSNEGIITGSDGCILRFSL